MPERLLLAAVAVLGVPIALIGYVTLVEGGLGQLSERTRRRLRPWLWMLPALTFLAAFLVYPALYTVYLSFQGPRSDTPVGLENYVYVFTSATMLSAVRNNLLWLVLFTLLTVSLGLLVAVLADRVAYEAAVKALVFLPMAISAVAAGVIWKFMYDFQPAGAPQTGTLNALLSFLVPGFAPQAWLINQPWNSVMLILAYAWVWVGFCMVILSAALKGISPEVLEAARVDGANEWQVFARVTVPMIGSTVAVVGTTMIIVSLKTFDFVYVTTNGNFDTEVIANRMYKEMFNFSDFGRASAIAVVLLAAIVPVMVFNIRRFREQEAAR